MRKIFFKFWPIVLIFFIWFIFASPYFLNNKVPFPSNYQVNNFAPWSANSRFWGPVKNSAMPDIITQIYPWRYLAIDIWKTGQVPLWNPYTFSGNPLLANYQSAVLSPLNILFFFLPFVDAWSILVLLQPLLAGLFTYLFSRSLKISKAGSLLSAISFMFCGFITTWMGYATLGYAILFLPFSLYCIEKYFESRRSYLLLLLTLTFPFSFFSGHFQISLYFLMGVMSFIIYKFIVTRNIRNTLYLTLSVFFGLLLVMPQVLPSLELFLQSFRSTFFQTNGIPVSYLPSLLAPDFFGNPVTRNTWFGNYAEWNTYVGLIPFVLAIYSLLGWKSARIQFFSIFGIIALVLATSNPISLFVQNLHIPILSTSAINRIIVLFSFSFTILAGFGIDQVIIDIKNGNKKNILVWLTIVSLLFGGMWIAVFQKIFIPIDKINVSRQNLLLPTTLFLSTSMIIVAFIFLQKIKQNIFISGIFIFGLLGLAAFDMARFAIKWQSFDPKSLVFPEFSTTKAFSQISGYDRAFGNLGGEATMYYKLPSVEGYDALYSKRYGQFIGYIEREELLRSNWSVVSFPKRSLNTGKAINLLDIKYIVHKLVDDRAPWTFPFWAYPNGQFQLKYKDNFYEFYQNNYAFPRAFLVSKYKVIKSDEEILKILFSDGLDLRHEIVLEEDPGIKTGKEGIGEVKITKYSPNRLEIEVISASDALLFITENYNEGWRATIDNKNTNILRADYAFKAIRVNAGKHYVVFKYDPWTFTLGIYLAIGGIVGILVTILISRSVNRSASTSS